MLPAQAIAPIITDEDGLLVALAREIAADLRSLPDILVHFNVTDDQFDRIKLLPRFNAYLEQHRAEWDSVSNTHERTRLKAAMLVEDWLPEAHRRIHDNKENLNAKTELAKLLARLAGMGIEKVDATATGDKISVTINLGSDHKLKFEHQLPPKVIDAEPVTT